MTELLADAAEPLDADTLMLLAEQIESLPPETAEWVSTLFQECLRARLHEAELLAESIAEAPGATDVERTLGEAELAQVALDVAEWLKTLWNVGYMGAGSFAAAPRSTFPLIELEDVLKSALFARIRQGKKPLPFPPPTRHGKPWHDIVEGNADTYAVAAEIVRAADDQPTGAIIEGDNGWQLVEPPADGASYLVQHRQRGPLFRLVLAPGNALLIRQAPQLAQQIRCQERAGIRSFTLHWVEDGSPVRNVPLRASTWERAESEAAHWIATHHPALYGRVRFEHGENTVF